MDFSLKGQGKFGLIYVASRKGCVDFSIKQESVNVSIKGSHLARDAWILAPFDIIFFFFFHAASRKGCVDFSIYVFQEY